MRRRSQRLAVCAMLVALGTAAMLMGGVIPLATFCAPALASLMLIPALDAYGRRWGFSVWFAIAALALMLSPDKESALLFAFLGYWPAVKPRLDRLERKPVRLLAKLALFNAAVLVLALGMKYLFGMDAVLREYAEMGRWMFAGFLVLSNITLLMYDRLIAVMWLLYRRRLKPRFL